MLLAFVGVKMILAHHVDIPNSASLCVILSILSSGAIASGTPRAGSPRGWARRSVRPSSSSWRDSTPSAPAWWCW